MRFLRAHLRSLLVLLLLFPLILTSTTAVAQEGEVPPALTDEQVEALSQQIIANMSIEQRVGQLFLVSFLGNDTGPNSDIAHLVRDLHVGGVMLNTGNENFRNIGDTPEAVRQLTNDLQTYAFRDLREPIVLPDGSLNPAFGQTGGIPGLPILTALDHEGDGYPYTRLINGFTPVPNNLAIGGTWQPAFARATGEVVGRELEAVGINLLLGPSLDVLDNPRPELKGYPGSRTFGGDAYWVAQMGQSYITGVHVGSDDKVATVAKHFPGQGASDRRPDREVATVQKSLTALQQVELAPFRAVTEEATTLEETTDAMMTSHVRYKGFQENPRQLTPPISLAPELQTIMEGFEGWRSRGGILVSDALGVRALKRYYQAYEPDRFPTRRVTQEAFLAGNDLLILSEFDRDDVWSEQLANMEDSINFFRQKYEEDPAFRARVDESLARIIKLKLKLYPQLSWTETQHTDDGLEEVLNQESDLVTLIARTASTLIFPGATEIADRLPSPPLPDERVLIFTDSRPQGDCPTCETVPAIPVDALEQIALRLYGLGPAASDQVDPELIDSASFAELETLLNQGQDPASVPFDQQLTPERFTELNGLINGADWIVFGMLDVDQETVPSSAALKHFLDQRADILRDKKLIVFAFNAPYFLSDTEIGKLTAYYGLYSKVEPFLETAIRTLFRELTPAGQLPVSVAGVNYNLDRQLEPDLDRPFPLVLLRQTDEQSEPQEMATDGSSIDIAPGDQIILRAGPVLDNNGHNVPDGTLVEFRFLDQQAGVELPRRQEITSDGIAVTQLTIERPGTLQLSASAGEGAVSDAPSILTISEEGGSLATATPTATPTATTTPKPSATPTPSPTPTATATLSPTPTPSPTVIVPEAVEPNPKTPAGLGVFFIAIIGNIIAIALHYLLSKGDRATPEVVVRNVLLSIIGAQALYLLYALGWLPGSIQIQLLIGSAGALIIAFVGGLLPFITDRFLPQKRLN